MGKIETPSGFGVKNIILIKKLIYMWHELSVREEKESTVKKNSVRPTAAHGLGLSGLLNWIRLSDSKFNIEIRFQLKFNLDSDDNVGFE